MYQGRALYNLLKMNLRQDSNISAKSWQVKEYRTLSEKSLFSALKKNQIILDKETFLSYVEESGSPEELIEKLFNGVDPFKKQELFLYIFELWRRFAPDKQTLSIFSDEMDHLIEEYEEGVMENEEKLEEYLLRLQQTLDNHVDEGGAEEDAFSLISPYFCHDLEAFIYEYIAYQIDQENDLYASEMLEGLYPYIRHPMWLDFLRIRLVYSVDEIEAKKMINRLLGSLQEQSDLPLLFELLYFLKGVRADEIYLSGIKIALNQVKTHSEIKNISFLIASYFNQKKELTKERHILELMNLKGDEALSSNQLLTYLKECTTLVVH